MMGCNVLSPQIFWFRSLRRNITVTFFMSIIVNIGMWFERFVIIVTSLYRDYLPSSWPFYYRPTIWEVGFYLGTFGLFFTCYFLFSKFFPVIAVAEIKHILKKSGNNYKAKMTEIEREPVEAFVTEHGTAHIALGAGNNVLQVRTLDDVLTAYPAFSCPDVLKIDTDGFEPAILRGAKAVLASSKPVVFYEWHPGYYNKAGEDNISHADFLMDLGYDGFTIFTNRGELLLHVRRPGHDILESLAQLSYARRRVDDFHFDIAAFPTERLNAWERLWGHYSNLGAALAL